MFIGSEHEVMLGYGGSPKSDELEEANEEKEEDESANV